ncbi:MAG: type II toxin-antitoxin system ParD family antitoxin [Verrucomicrobia bacterium]|nr:type II toxin-antitoxin system ParD family antitoxin [Verrucomicrobiota bacterium]
MTSLAIQLPDELSQFVSASVNSGGYQDADEFFVSILSTFREQAESTLTDEESAKLASLRADIQHAVDQADLGEVIRDFDMTAFLAERHREHAARQTA